MRRLDDNTLQHIARLICGDDGPYYRKGYLLERFLTSASWTDVPEFDGAVRQQWVLTRLLERRDNAVDIKSALLRLCDSREYLGEPDGTAAEVTRKLNEVLIHEGYKVERPGGRPRLVECDPAAASPSSLASESLQVTMDQVVADPGFARVLQGRLNEAQSCSDNGCFIATLILLGGLLEGVLIDAALVRLPDRRPAELRRTNLVDLIRLAHQNRWIGADVVDYCHALRDYRNLVHPNAETRLDDPVDRDTLNMAWPVVHATLNDLADSRAALPAPRAAATRPQPRSPRPAPPRRPNAPSGS